MMSETTRKSVTTKILESWYTIDEILFGQDAKLVITESDTFKDYVTIKSSMLTNLFEYYDVIGYTPKNNKPVTNVNMLTESSKVISETCKKISSKVLNTEMIKKDITAAIVSESKKCPKCDSSKLADAIIHEKFIQLTMDNALIGVPLMESKHVDNASNFRAKILQESHKIMRDSLIRLALTVK